MKQIDIFPWDDSFNTGLSTVDVQHRKLVQLLNDLASQFAFQSDHIKLDMIFDELLAYTVYHFKTEEDIWTKYLPNDKSEIQHRMTHRSFVDELHQMIASQKDKPMDEVAENTLGFLVQWLASHILESDRFMAYVVHGIKEGLSLTAAKEKAAEQMSGFTRKMIDIILSIYGALSSNTLRLMQELSRHRKLEAELVSARENSQKILEDNFRAKSELAYQHNFSKSLIQTLPDLVWMKDPGGVYMACNARFERFFGAAEEVIKGKNDYDFLELKLANIFRVFDKRAIESGSPISNEEWVTFADDGHHELLEITSTPMNDGDGDLIGVLSIGHNVTKNRVLHQQLVEERDRSQRYLDTVETLIVSLDNEGCITMLNRKGSYTW